MTIDVSPVAVEAILSLRDLYRKEMNCQIVHDSLHARGFTLMYLVRVDGQVAGYGCALGFGKKPKDTVREFYVLPVHRAAALPLFRAFVAASGARKIEAQTNDVLLTLLLFDCAHRIKSETILFHDAFTTHLSVPNAAFRKITEAEIERFFPGRKASTSEWMIEVDGVAAATGGILFHYNLPYGDIWMEVMEPFRRRGYGSYLVQELKRACYEMGRVPAARCSVKNTASRMTLQKAGLLPCARIVSGVIAP